eukprot:9946406-Alexandrium_andersonii.AAC.1
MARVAAGAPVGAGGAPGGSLSRPLPSESPDAGGRKRGAGDAGLLRSRAFPDPMKWDPIIAEVAAADVPIIEIEPRVMPAFDPQDLR